MATHGLLAWLPSVQGLRPEAKALAQRLFVKHQIDKDFLDFIFSDDGLRIMDAYLRGNVIDGIVQQVAMGGEAEAVDGLEVLAQLPAEPRRATAKGRQKISEDERRGEGHYFARPARAGARHSSPASHAYSSQQASAPSAPARTSSNYSAGSVTSASMEAPVPFLATPPHKPPASMQALTPIMGAPAMLTATSRVLTPGSRAGSDGPLAHPRDGEEVVGTLKSFNEANGYGFVSAAGVPGDIFLQRSQLPDGLGAEENRRLRCTLWHDTKGRPQARNVVWLANAAPVQAMESQNSATRFLGKLKSMGTYGFIECTDTFRLYGHDVYIKRAQLGDDWHLGLLRQTVVSFEVSLDAHHGRPQAKNVQQAPLPASVPIDRHAPAAISTETEGTSYTCSSSDGAFEPTAPQVVASRW